MTIEASARREMRSLVVRRDNSLTILTFLVRLLLYFQLDLTAPVRLTAPTLAVRLSGRLTEIVGRADYLKHPDPAGRRRDDPMRAGRAVVATLTEGR